MTDEARARETLYVQFSDYGQHIRKWSLEPFDGALAFAQPPSPTVETVLAYEAGIEEGKRQLGNQGESREASARMGLMYLETGFVECEQCGNEVKTNILDATYELRAALSPSHSEASDEPT